jgi:hypothetical protein
VDKNDGQSLALGEAFEGTHQVRLVKVLPVIRDFEAGAGASLPTPALSHPEEITRQVLDVLQATPVFPGIRESLCRGIASLFGSIHRRESTTEAGLGMRDERLERPFSLIQIQRRARVSRKELARLLGSAPGLRVRRPRRRPSSLRNAASLGAHISIDPSNGDGHHRQT